MDRRRSTASRADTFGVVLADLMMPKLDGLALLKEMQARGDPAPSASSSRARRRSTRPCRRCVQGAYDYIEKPLNAEKLNRLKALIPKALDKFNDPAEESASSRRRSRGSRITASSPASRRRCAPSTASSTRSRHRSASVLILGESGTGKELVARAIHNKSDRAKGPFFALNCAALPKDILENELFGHEKGAFTGSTNEKAGAFEMAHGGTIFLDEVAEMAPDIQVKLLRALETRTIRRLGGKREIAVDIRIVAATNKNLQKAIAESELREDLYYRLAVVEIFLPPLRERVRRRQAARERVSRSLCAAERQEGHGVRRRRVDVDPELPLAGQRARAEECGRARGDHGDAVRRSRVDGHRAAPPASRRGG